MDIKFIILIAVALMLIFFLLRWLIPFLKVRKEMKKLEAQLKRRCEIVPGFIEMIHDSFLQGEHTMAAVTNLINLIVTMKPSLEYFTKNAELSEEIGRLLFTSNNYPELKIKEGYENVYNELNELEKTIDSARRTYNENVLSYNNKISKFPYKIFKIKHRALYETKIDKIQNKYSHLMQQ